MNTSVLLQTLIEDQNYGTKNRPDLFADLLSSLNDELPDELMNAWGSDSGASNGLSNGSLDGLVPAPASNSIAVSQPGPGLAQSNMPGMRPGPGPGGMPMNQMGTMANPNQNMTLVNALSGVRGPTPSSTPNNSISDSSLNSMGGPMGQQGPRSQGPAGQANHLPAVVSSMAVGPGQPNMMAGPIRPGMNMGGMGPGAPQTIMSQQMPNGPNTMVRTVGGMVGPRGPMPNMIRQPGGMIAGQPRMMGTGVRMAITVSVSPSGYRVV